MKLEEARCFANAMTHDRRRAEAMGWRFTDIRVEDNWEGDGVMLDCRFTCVCGTPEAFRQVYPYAVVMDAHPAVAEQMFDVALLLRRAGSFSRAHLLADGYTEAQVAEFERKGAEFDRQHGRGW